MFENIQWKRWTFNAEILPKKSLFLLIQVASFVITGYSLTLNFDSIADMLSTLGIWGVEIYVG